LTSRGLFAQQVFGSIFGTITDPSGAFVPNAKVAITNVNQGTKYDVTTNTDGNYSRGQLIPGTYSVEVEATGFRKAVARQVEVNVDSATRVDLKMEVGNVAETVEVTAEAPLIKSDKADVATTFTAQQLSTLPNLNRNFQNYLLLVPGTQKLSWQHASSENPQGSSQIMVNGNHFSGTGYQLDGTDNQDPILGIVVINSTLESVGEARVITQNYDAEHGQAIAGVVIASTKSGTNELHGSLFEYLRNNSPGFQSFARNSFNSAEDKGTPPLKYNQFGASIGGPVLKNKLFFFGDYQGTRQRIGGTVLTQVPTVKARQGDFSEYLETLPGSNVTVMTTSGRSVPLQRNMIFDPMTGDAATGAGRRAFETDGILNKIPAARLNASALKLIQQLPEPNARDTAGSLFRRNFAGSASGRDDNNQFNTRWDYYLNSSSSLFGRYSFADFDRGAPGAFGDLLGGPAIDNFFFGGQSKVRNQSLSTGFNHTFSPSMLGEFRFGYMRYRVNVLPNGFGTSPARDAGIPGLNVDETFTSGMPAFFLQGDGDDRFIRFGYALDINSCNCPLAQREQVYQWVTNISKISGNHTFKFGGDLRYGLQLRVPSDSHRSGELTFQPGFTGYVQGAQTLQGFGPASFLLGQVTRFRRYVSPNTDAQERQKRFYWYGQDTWRATSKLTLNLGLRWEMVFPETVNAPGNGGQLDLRTGEIAVFGVGGVSMHGIQEMKWTNFAPRLGVTYQITPKTVVRTGYGWSYALGTFGSIFGHNVTQNLPVLAIQDLNRPNDFSGVFTLAQGPPAPTFPTPNAQGRFLLPDGVSGKARPQNLRMPRVMAYNLTVQHQLTDSMSVEAGYVGNSGRHSFTGDGPNFNVNEPAFVPGVADTNIRRPFYSKYGWTQGIDYYCTCATTRYDSLQLKLDRRFSSGYGMNAWYVFQKAVNDNGSFEFLYNRELGRGAADWDITHSFNINQNLEIPFGKGRRFGSDAHRVINAVLGGWSLDAISRLRGGYPFTPKFDSPGGSVIRPNAGPGDRPDIGQGDPYSSNKDRNHWIASGLGGPFLVPANNTFGNFGRNTLRGPALFSQDLALSKTFHPTERFSFAFRAEAYNALNHVNLGQPNNNVTSADAGRITSLANDTTMRRLQFGLRMGF
jgi:outer membrane receptor protein involved in Fe transport